MSRAGRLRSVLVAMAITGSGCGLLAPGPRVAPAGGAPMEPDLRPVGPVVELGRGEAFGIAWR